MPVGHFEREAWLQLLVPAAILVIGLVATVLGVTCFGVIDAARVDACLDSGGSYDYEAERCDQRTNHPAP